MIATATGTTNRRNRLRVSVVALLLILTAGCGREPVSHESPDATRNSSGPTTGATIQQPRTEAPPAFDIEAVLTSIPEDTATLRQRLREELDVNFTWYERDDGKVLIASLGFNKSLQDKDLIALAGLEGPLEVSLTRTAITDAGLALLARMRATERQGRPLLAEIHHLYLNATRISDRGLPHLAAFGTLRTLDLSDTQVTDAGLSHLARLSQLQRLFLSRTQMTGSGLVHLQSLSALRELDLTGTALDDTGLQQLPSLPNLRKLVLRNTRITDAGLDRLKALPALEELDLTGTGITDGCVASIKELKRLRRLRIVDKTKLTERGAIQLRLALPDYVYID